MAAARQRLQRRYAAFISYSHALDGQLAPALQRGLQRFAKRWHELRALTVFRDEASLSTNPDLWHSIEAALERADYFLLLASPNAARSAWVAREAAWWRANRPLDRLLIVLTDGALDWDEAAGDFRWDATTPLPPTLRGAFTTTPRHLDLRWVRSPSTDLSLQNNRFREAIADVAATLHGRPKEDLIGEEVTQHRKVRRLARGAMAALALLTLASVGAAVWALRQEERATEQARIAEEARQEAVHRLADVVFERAMLERTRNRSDLVLALLYKLATDPALAAAAEQSKIEAQLPRAIGDWMLAKLAPPPFSVQLQEESSFSRAAGIVGGEPVLLRTLVKPNHPAVLELRGLVDQRLLGSLANAAYPPGLDLLITARILGSQLVLLIATDGSRELRGVPADGGTLPLLRRLPVLLRNPNGGGFYLDSTRLSPDGATLVVATQLQVGLGLVIEQLVQLPSGNVTTPDPAGDVRFAPSGLLVAKQAFRLAGVDANRVLMLVSAGLAVIDVASGTWSQGITSPIATPGWSAGLAPDGMWVANGEEIVLLAPDGSERARRRIANDYVTEIVGRADLVALHRCDKDVTLLQLRDLNALATLPVAAGCDTAAEPPAPHFGADGTLAVLGKGKLERYRLSLLSAAGEELRAAELPYNFPMDFLLDAGGRWVMVTMGGGYPQVAPLTARRDELLLLTRQALGPLAEQPLDTLLQAPPAQ